MNDHQPDAFTLWGNFNKNKNKDGHYWSQLEVPLDELRALFEWAKTADRTQNRKGQDCVSIRANLMPRTTETGNDYFLMAMSDAKPKPAGDIPF